MRVCARSTFFCNFFVNKIHHLFFFPLFFSFFISSEWKIIFKRGNSLDNFFGVDFISDGGDKGKRYVWLIESRSN